MGSTSDAFTWLYGTLSGSRTLMSDCPGGVHRDLAPVGSATPYIIVSRAGGADVVTATATRIYSDDRYQVKVVGPASVWATIEAAYDLLDSLINQQGNYATGGTILSCYREQPFHVTELVDGQPWDNLGGLYRIEIESTL